MKRPSTAIVGAGRLARSLAPRLAAAGYPIVAVAAPTLSHARALARRTGASAGTDPVRAAYRASLVLLAVPDRRIAEVSRMLARGARDLAGTTVLHHAGSLGVEPLRPLAKQGASTGVLHPFQVLSDPRLAGSLLPGSFARIEGDRRARSVASRLARDLHLVPFRIPRPFGGRERAAYHAAASLVSNDLVALLHLAAEVLEAQGIGRKQALGALVALAIGTLAHAERGGLESALTGPIARGDVATVAAQLASLRRFRAGEAHGLLGRELVGLARRSGRIGPAEAAALRRLLDARTGRGPGRTV
jgi:predicted short-subunit dehydrogenase-like oxidoreductase (DUF2520 family)